MHWLESVVCVRADDSYIEDDFDGLKGLWVEVMVSVTRSTFGGGCDGVSLIVTSDSMSSMRCM